MDSVNDTHGKNCQICGNLFFRAAGYSFKYWKTAKFCSRLCSAKFGALLAEKRRPSFEEAFWANVSKAGVDDCWEWAGSRDYDGYGLFQYYRKSYRANRTALKVSGVFIPDGYYACHRCHNRGCCNPKHLYAGTPLQNSLDKNRNGTHLSGTECHCAKLSESDVSAIRQDPRRNGVIAKDYNVSASNIWMIKSRKTWKHIP